MTRQAKTLRIIVALPPTSDHLTSAQFRWRTEALAHIEAQLAGEPFTRSTGIRVRLVAGPAPHRALHDVLAPVVRLLADAGLIGSARAVSAIEAKWSEAVPPGEVEVELAPAPARGPAPGWKTDRAEVGAAA